MILLVSPTKTMKTDAPKGTTTPLFVEIASQLMHQLQQLDITELQALFKCNEKIAHQVANYNINWNSEGYYQALALFDGLQFKSMDIESWSNEDIDYASNHLMIMSGLYGILRASDRILPYRLDFNDKLDGNKVNLIHQTKIHDHLLDLNEIIIDACSKEYQVNDLRLPRIEVQFLENGKSKSTVAKQARGYFTRYFIKERVNSIEQIKAFSAHGFLFDDKLSTDKRLVFNREG